MRIESVRAASDLLEHTLYSTDIRCIRPAPGSFVSSLVLSSGATSGSGSDEEIFHQANTVSSTFGIYSHMEEDFAQILAKAVSRIETAASTVVNPLAKKIAEEIERTRIQEQLNKNNLAITTKLVELPNLFTSNLVSELTRNHTIVNHNQVTKLGRVMSFVDKQLTPDERTELVKTGSSIDSSLLTYFGDTEKLFQSIIYSLDDNARITPLRPKELLYAFFLLLGVKNQRVEVLSSLLVDAEIKADLSVAISKISNRIQGLVNSYANMVKSGCIFITNMNVVDDVGFANTIYLVKQNYLNWCKSEKGSANAVLGKRYVTSGSIQTYEATTDLKNNAARYELVYGQKVKSAETLSIIEDQGIVRKVTSTLMTDYINNLQDVRREAFHNRLKEALQRNFHGVADLIPYLIKVVSRTLYASSGDPNDKTHSDVKNFCLEVSSMLTSNPNMEIEEAKRIARIRLLAKAVSRQLICTKI